MDKKKDFFIIDSAKLNEYDKDNFWIFERVFDGNRLSEENLISYLGLKNKDDLKEFFKKRSVC